MNETNYERSDITSDKGGQYSSGFLFVLPVIFCMIFIGNVLLLVAIKSFRIRRVPDQLVGSLAVIDLLNDLGPVLISIVVFQIDHRGFQSGRISYELCHFYNWISSFLRLSASFVASLMAVDCFCATLQPIYYRTKVTSDKATKLILCVVLSGAFISALPAMGWGRVLAHKGICSFNFNGGFALCIATLGYVQLIMVLTCFIAVARKMSKYEKRFNGLRRGRTLTFLNGRLQAMEMQTANEGRISHMDENGIQGGSNIKRTCNTTRGISTLAEDDDSNKITEEKCEQNEIRRRESKTDPSVNRCSVNRNVKESRQFTKVLGSVVFLFYVSWMPIIVSLSLMRQLFVSVAR